MYPNPHQHQTNGVGVFQLSFVVFEKLGNNILTYIHTDRRKQNIILDTSRCPFKFERGKALTRELGDKKCINRFELFCFVLFFFLFCLTEQPVAFRWPPVASIVLLFDGVNRTSIVNTFQNVFLVIRIVWMFGREN